MSSPRPSVKLTTLRRATQRTNQQVVIRKLGGTPCLWRGLSDGGKQRRCFQLLPLCGV